ncbi:MULTISPECIES: transposase [Xanthomonas]|uniref:transposase n=1 Tax=Xanthomonas TaxID=338 RepID=UPI0022556BA3|nr:MULTISPECIES: transposase [Xanthomonas]MDY4282476.1 transposase [Xanthomonas sp. LF06-19]
MISQKLWQERQPLVPLSNPLPEGGQLRRDDRAAFNDILFVLKTDIPWEDLCVFGSSMTC